MAGNLTEGDKKRIAAIVQGIVNAKVIREITRIYDEQKAEERRAIRILLFVLAVIVTVAFIIFV